MRSNEIRKTRANVLNSRDHISEGSSVPQTQMNKLECLTNSYTINPHAFAHEHPYKYISGGVCSIHIGFGSTHTHTHSYCVLK